MLFTIVIEDLGALLRKPRLGMDQSFLDLRGGNAFAWQKDRQLSQ